MYCPQQHYCWTIFYLKLREASPARAKISFSFREKFLICYKLYCSGKFCLRTVHVPQKKMKIGAEILLRLDACRNIQFASSKKYPSLSSKNSVKHSSLLNFSVIKIHQQLLGKLVWFSTLTGK